MTRESNPTPQRAVTNVSIWLGLGLLLGCAAYGFFGPDGYLRFYAVVVGVPLGLWLSLGFYG